MTRPADLVDLPSAVAGLDVVALGAVALLLIGVLMIVPFGPAEAAAVAAGTLAQAGVVPGWVALLVVAATMLLGDLLVFAAAGPLLDRARPRRPGRSRQTPRPWLGSLLTVLGSHPRWRDVGLVGLRFIPGGRSPMTLVAREIGTTRTHFCLVAGVGSLLWAGAWTCGGSALADAGLDALT